MEAVGVEPSKTSVGYDRLPVLSMHEMSLQGARCDHRRRSDNAATALPQPAQNDADESEEASTLPLISALGDQGIDRFLRLFIGLEIGQCLTVVAETQHILCPVLLPQRNRTRR